MLWLPKAISAWFQVEAVNRDTSVGSLLIQIVCKWAWENGYQCDHPAEKIKFKALVTEKGIKYRQERCQQCGMLYLTAVESRGGTGSRQKLGYPIVGFVESP